MVEDKCIIKNCDSTTSNLFCSPVDEQMLKKWQEIIGTQEKSFLVCQNHFSSKDILIEKYLEHTAVPVLKIIDEESSVENDTCGTCLEKLEENKIQLSKQESDSFKAITGYEPVKEYICESCNKFLKTYQLFKTDIKEKHKRLRFKEKPANEDSEDDCVVVSEEKIPTVEITDKTSEETFVPKVSHPRLPPSIRTVKVLNDGKKISALFRCKHCYYKTNDRSSLIDHIDVNHYFPCKQCPFISSNKPLLTLHVNKFHTKDKTSIICGICDEKFDNKNEIDNHYEKNHDEQTCSYFMCFYCKTNCPTGKELKLHYSQFHSNGLTTAQHQINNTKLQLALLIGNKERRTDESKQKSYKEIMKKIKKSVTIKKVSNGKKADDIILPINIPIPFEKSKPKPKPKPSPKITEVTIVSKPHNFVEKPESVSNSESDEEYTAEVDDAISLDDSDSDSDYFEPLKKVAKKPANDQDNIKFVLKNRVKSIKEGQTSKEHGTEVNKNAEKDLRYVFRCFSCNEYYDDVTKLLEHREKAHPPSEKLKSYENFDLSKIPKDPYRIERKKAVTQTEGGLGKVACDICFFLVQEKNLQKHKQLRHSEKQYLCHVCSQAFADQTSFRYHIMKHEPETLYQCDMCEKNWVTKGLLAKHIKRTHLRIPHIKAVCPICNKKLYKSMKKGNVLEIHMSKYHPDGKDEGYRVNQETNYYDCERCGASYWDLYTFSRHNCEKGRLQIRCLDCMMPCSNEKSLAKHRVTKCRKINPFTNSYSLKSLNIEKTPPNEYPFHYFHKP